jgi:hypothetical protein
VDTGPVHGVGLTDATPWVLLKQVEQGSYTGIRLQPFIMAASSPVFLDQVEDDIPQLFKSSVMSTYDCSAWLTLNFVE